MSGWAWLVALVALAVIAVIVTVVVVRVVEHPNAAERREADDT